MLCSKSISLKLENIIVLMEGNLPKPGNPYCGLTNQRPTDRPTDQPLAEELKYSRNRAQQYQCPTNNLLEVWQNLAVFSGRLIGGTVEALLTKVLNQQSTVSRIVVFFVALRRAAGSMIIESVITQSHGTESMILSVGGTETIMLSAHAESIILSAPPAKSIIASAPPDESMILSAPRNPQTLRHGASTMHPALK
jgi:hypothetical protein